MALTAIEILNGLIVDRITNKTIVSEVATGRSRCLAILRAEQEQRVIDDLIMLRKFYTNRPFEVDPSDPNIYMTVDELVTGALHEDDNEQ